MAAERRRTLLLVALLSGCGWTPEPEKARFDLDGGGAGAPDAAIGPRVDGSVNAPDGALPDAAPSGPDAAPQPDAGAASDAAAPADDAATGDAALPDAGSPDAGPPPPCEPPAVDPCGPAPCGRCVVTFRLDHTTLARRGHVARCFDAPALPLSVEAAAARAGLPADRLVTPADARDVFVFWEPPLDFGRGAVISALAGGDADPLLFAGTTVWDGRGDVETPADAELAADVGSEGCAAADAASLRFTDLVDADAADRRLFFAAWDAVARTGLAHRMAAPGGRLAGAVVRYARSVGAFDPTSAEWIVVIIRDSEP